MAKILPFLIALTAIALFTRADYFFYLLYALVGIYVLGRVWARRALASVSLERLHDQRVFLGESLAVEIKLHNRGWLPVLWMRLTDAVPAELSPGPGHRYVVSLRPKEKAELRYSLHGRRRGYYRIGPLMTVGGDLLGSTTYQSRHASDDYVIVYPKLIALRHLGFPSLSPFGTLPSRERIFEDPTRIQGVRDYQPGDSLRRMDWKTSARAGSLQVRRYEPAISMETAIYLNLGSADYGQRERQMATELGIVVAASVARHVVELRQAVSLATNGHDPLHDSALSPEGLVPAPSLPLRKGREHLMHVLDLLARIEVAEPEDTPPFLDLLNRHSLQLPWGSTVVVITAREVEGLLASTLALRQRGLAVTLALTCPDRAYAQTARRAEQIGVQAVRTWSQQDLDVWR